MLKLKLQYFGHLMQRVDSLEKTLMLGGEGDDRGWDGWMASSTQWTWVWVNPGSWWWTRRPGMLWFMGLQRVRHNWATELNWTELLKMGFPAGSEFKASTCNEGDLGLIPGSGRSPGEGNDNALQYSCLENPMNGGAWWATVHGVSMSQTWLNNFTAQNNQYIIKICQSDTFWSGTTIRYFGVAYASIFTTTSLEIIDIKY